AKAAVQRARSAAGPPKADSPDVQAAEPPRPYRLTRVGVRGVKKPVTVHRPGMEAHGVVATFDLFVDLPKTQKGTHMSRNLEALADILDEEVALEAPSLENLCRRLAVRLLEKHDYASHAHVKAEADYFLTRTNPGGKPSVENYRLLAEAEAFRSAAKGAKGARSRPPRTARRVGVQVVGMSACPCAMETVRHKLGAKVPKDLPFITHNQRNRVTLVLDVPGEADVEAADLVQLCEDSLSAPTFELLKRGDEGDLVLQAHHNPRFVEDVVREVLHKAADRYRALGDAVKVFVSSEAEESIHKHNAYAERTTTFGDL
ncbi:MAG TPA: GTP cyclohydrolase MptA, partial [Candidatus Thermoplasmatota archaeon]|nr:GTP cyclohydrolase MptA [Candidatus Thermoplasmatota archaeon]